MTAFRKLAEELCKPGNQRPHTTRMQAVEALRLAADLHDAVKRSVIVLAKDIEEVLARIEETP